MIYVIVVIIMIGLINQYRKNIAGQGGGLTDSLISYYNFNNNALDQVDNNNGVAGAGTSYTTGKSGQAINTTGTTSSIVEVTDNNDFNFTDGAGNDNPFSVSYYVKFVSSVSRRGWMISKTEVTTAAYGWEVYLNYGALAFILRDASNNYLLQSITAPFSINTWYHIIATYDGSNSNSGMKIYLNGVLLTTTPSEVGVYAGLTSTTKSMTIGEIEKGYGFGNGNMLIDGLGIWNKDLSQLEVTEIYNTQNGGAELI